MATVKQSFSFDDYRHSGKQEFYSFLKTNINHRAKNIRHLAVSSVAPSKERTALAENIACQLAREGNRVLFISTDLTYKSELASKGGLTHLLAQLLGRPVSKGQILDYGLLDLFFLVYLQQRTGTLELLTRNNNKYTATFRQGIVCRLETPNYKMSDIDANLKMKKASWKELARTYNQELQHLFQEFKRVSFVSFAFYQSMVLGLKKVPKLLGDTYPFIHEQLEGHNYILRCLHLNSFKREHNFFIMNRGTHALNLAKGKSYQSVSSLLELLSRHYDRIVVDTPTLCQGQDGALLCGLSEGALIVIDHHNVSRFRINRAVHKLKDADVNIVGTVLG
ncbi:MAG: hypothetical protein ABII18_01715 [bacterium]|nr:hypothetical protein [bacterium]